MHRMRTLGLGVGRLPIASVLYANDASAWAWGLLLFNGLAWPHVAWWLAPRSHDPRGAEFRNLILDPAAGGAWIAMKQFNLLPSAFLVTMLTVDKISVAGLRFLDSAVPTPVHTVPQDLAPRDLTFRPGARRTDTVMIDLYT